MKLTKPSAKSWFLMLATLLLAIVGSLSFKITNSLNQTMNWQQTSYQVASGQSFSKICRELIINQVISDCFGHKVLAKLGALSLDVRSGTFATQPGQSLTDFVQVLIDGEELQLPVTIVEGENIYQVIDKLEQLDGIENDVTGMSLTTLSDLLDLDVSHPEGYLYPETYYYTYGTKASDLLKRAVRKQRELIDLVWQQAEQKQGLNSPYDMLILASIIEKESSVHAERDTIASVFFNRLEKGMRLQTDPTVIYGVWSEYKGDITRRHLKEKTPYNTYRINGLPPTPISNPSEASMRAVMNPATTDYLYFVASGDGKHVFNKTLKEHNKAVKAYLKKMSSSE